MKRCENCKHFGDRDPISYFDEDGNEHESKHHMCLRIPQGNSSTTHETLHEPAVVTDGSGYIAVLRVLAHFSCDLFEER